MLSQQPSALRFALLALLAPALLAGVLIWLSHEYKQSEGLRVSVVTSSTRRMATADLLSKLVDAESAQRGYLLTGGDPAFLARYEPARAAVRRLLPSTDEGIAVERTAARRIAVLASAKFAEMDRALADQRRGDPVAARARVKGGAGRRLMEGIRAAAAVRMAAEQRLANAVRERYRARSVAIRRSVLSAGLFAIALVTALLYSGWLLRRSRFDATVAAFEAAERNQAVLDSTMDAMLILDPNGTIEAINPAATAMLGYDPGDLVHRDIAAVIDLAPGDGPFHQRLGLKNGRLDRSFLPDREARRRDGGVLPVDVAMGTIMLPGGDHLVVSLRDISERKRVDQLKDDLMSTVSHELRTPLTSIVGSLGLLRAGSAGALPEAATRLVAIADNNSRRLIRLINDMLDIDRIESGRLEMRRDPIDLRAVLEQAAQASEGLAAAKSGKVALAAGTDPVIVCGDADRLLQVATNLLSNAIRFTPPAGTVTLGLLTDADGRAMVTVDDQGPGVPAEFRSRIFGRFERAVGEAGTAGGAGLGLAISHEIVARHGGRLWYEDAPGGGARFVFALDWMGPAVPPGQGSARVLIGQQDCTLAARLIAMTVAEGCAVELATTTAQARAALARDAFAAVLVDLNLPGDGGLAFARAAREGSPPVDSPIIVVAGAAQAGESPAALDVVDWIEKPADVARLSTERLSTAVRRAASRSGRDPPTVLHLDDDRNLRQAVARALGPETRIVAASDLAAARTILETTSPDAAILDPRLADGSGLDLVPFLIDRDGVAIPTILCSAQDVAVGPTGGVDAVLVTARESLPDLEATLRRAIRAGKQDRRTDA